MNGFKSILKYIVLSRTGEFELSVEYIVNHYGSSSPEDKKIQKELLFSIFLEVYHNPNLNIYDLFKVLDQSLNDEGTLHSYIKTNNGHLAQCIKSLFISGSNNGSGKVYQTLKEFKTLITNFDSQQVL